MNYHVYRRSGSSAEEVSSMGRSKGSPYKHTALKKLQQTATPEFSDSATAQTASSEEERDATVPTPTRISNNKIRAMREKFEKTSSSREQPPKKTVSCGTIAERKRQLGFLKGAENIILPRGAKQEKVVHSQRRVSPPIAVEALKSTFIKNRITKAKFADKKKIFDRVLEWNEVCTEANNSKVTTEAEAEAAVTRVLSDSDFTQLDYNASVFSDDNTTARDEVEGGRPCPAKENRDMVGPQQLADDEALLYSDNSLEEALNDIVASFEKEVSTREAEESASMMSNIFTKPELVAVTKPSNSDTNDESEANAFSEEKSSLSPKSTQPRYLPHSHLLPGAALFSTVNQKKNKEKVSNNEQHANLKPVQLSRKKSNEMKAAEMKSRRAITPLASNLKKLSMQAESSPTATATTATDSTRYEVAESKSQLRQRCVDHNLSPISTASWYSSDNSIATSEVSQQLSPLQQDPNSLATNSNRMSVGACISAHLAENPLNAAPQTSKPREQSQGKEGTQNPRRAKGGSLASSICKSDGRSLEVLYDGSVIHDAQDLQELAEAMSKMANTASTAVLDVFVEAADKVVVSPLISIFHCVDASEHLLCNGAQAPPEKLDGKMKRTSRSKARSKARSESRSRESKT